MGEGMVIPAEWLTAVTSKSAKAPVGVTKEVILYHLQRLEIQGQLTYGITLQVGHLRVLSGIMHQLLMKGDRPKTLGEAKPLRCFNLRKNRS